jgi:ribosome-associated heat shock protein Hsp15
MTQDGAEPDTIRLDKWLWQARFYKTRSIAAKLCASGRVRVDGIVVRKAHYAIRPGLVLTFPQARTIRVVRVMALGHRRGPAPEARALYENLVENPDQPPVRLPARRSL